MNEEITPMFDIVDPTTEMAAAPPKAAMFNGFEIRPAQRKRAKTRTNFSGPSGSGKTLSALLFAFGLVGDWSKIVMIDTENGSGELYEGSSIDLPSGQKITVGSYGYLRMEAPFSPMRYSQAIRAAENAGAECIVIDSTSHEWEGPGGCLEMVDRLGGKFADWAKVTPQHQAFLHSITSSPAHVVTTTRRKQDYVIEVNDRGKSQPKKVGLKEVQRDGFEYELTLAFEINMEHDATVTGGKDRTGLFAHETIPFRITPDTGRLVRDWNETGAEPEAPVDRQAMLDFVGSAFVAAYGEDKAKMIERLGTITRALFAAESESLRSMTNAQLVTLKRAIESGAVTV